jgi:hypothetical protein
MFQYLALGHIRIKASFLLSAFGGFDHLKSPLDWWQAAGELAAANVNYLKVFG